MKIRELIETLLEDNELDDEILIAYWDKNYFVEDSDLPLDKVNKVWEEFVKEGQETINGHFEFTQTGYDLANDLEEMTKEID